MNAVTALRHLRGGGLGPVLKELQSSLFVMETAPVWRQRIFFSKSSILKMFPPRVYCLHDHPLLHVKVHKNVSLTGLCFWTQELSPVFTLCSCLINIWSRSRFKHSHVVFSLLGFFSTLSICFKSGQFTMWLCGPALGHSGASRLIANIDMLTFSQ